MFRLCHLITLRFELLFRFRCPLFGFLLCHLLAILNNLNRLSGTSGGVDCYATSKRWAPPSLCSAITRAPDPQSIWISAKEAGAASLGVSSCAVIGAGSLSASTPKPAISSAERSAGSSSTATSSRGYLNTRRPPSQIPNSNVSRVLGRGQLIPAGIRQSLKLQQNGL